MNTTLLYRLVWKETRALRALWLSLLGLGLLLSVAVVCFGDRHGLYRAMLLFNFAAWIPAVYSLALVAMAFAGEREEGTDQLLSRLAAPPLALLSVKLSLNLLSTIVLFAALSVPAWALDSSSVRASPAFFQSMHLLTLMWWVGLLTWGLFFSLLFRRVMPCLIAATVATGTTLLLVPVMFLRHDLNDAIVHLSAVAGLLLICSVWLVQTWDENRWPRLIEWLFRIGNRLSRWRLRINLQSLDAATPTNISTIKTRRSVLQTNLGSCSELLRLFLRLFGLCQPDEWLPAWRREVRRLLWLEWRSAWKVSLGLVVAGSSVLIALVSTSGSQTDLKLAMSILPLVLATVIFVLGVWSFHGEQREQHFRFFATHGASPIAMWVVKHVVWLSCAIVAVVTLLCISAMVSEKAILEKEIMEGDMRNVVEATRDRHMGWNGVNPVEPLNRFVFCLSNATKTSLDFVHNPKDLPSYRPLIALVVLSLGRGLIAAWLCFSVGQLVSLMIPRAVTSVLVGLLVLGVTVAWWYVISMLLVPLAIAVLPLLVGLLAAAWGRMSDWLEERSGWRRWLRLAVTVMAPAVLAFVGMAVYRVYEVPFVELPWQSTGLMTSTAEARKTGEDWVRLSERLESPWGSEDAPKNMIGEDHVPVLDMDINRIEEAHWHGFAERDWLTKNSEILEEAMQLAKRSGCVMPKSWSWIDQRKNQQLGRVAMLLKMSALESLANHRLDEAMQRALALYQFGIHLGRDLWNCGRLVQHAGLHVLREWAMSGDQTTESLLTALGRSKSETSHPVAQLVRAEGVFAVDPQELLRAEYAYSAEMQDQRWRDAVAVQRWLFWEQWREERLLNVLAAEGAANLRRAMRHNPSPHLRILDESYDRLLQNVEEDSDGTWNTRGQRWQKTTWEITLGWGWSEYEVKNFYLPKWASREAHRRGLWLTIALQAYRLQHGKLPERFDELVGPFMDRLPTDPSTGQAFEYRAGGVPIELLSDGRRLPPNTPYLSVPGLPGARCEPILNDYRRRKGFPVDDSQSNGDVEWLSILSNPYEYGQTIGFGHFLGVGTFSLAPSF